MNKVFALLLVTILLAGCNSNPAKKSNYYLLNSSTAQSESSQLIAQPDYVLERIRMPDYLVQPNLVMQLSDHRLHYAGYDIWAESLQAGVSKVLVSELQNRGLKIHDHSETDLEVNRLFVRIDHFYPTDNSEVILSGKYWVEDPVNRKVLSGSQFSFQGKLERDGYAHSVAKMRELVSRLSKQLNSELN
ncbi:MAG: PqiC family protein [Kangiellaceae bacterium]|nr:PqiC family protein [Kangiellaceae bacterium]MCW9016541.1 PqiC family protein [Kangiellaceae bacterium]